MLRSFDNWTFSSFSSVLLRFLLLKVTDSPFSLSFSLKEKEKGKGTFTRTVPDDSLLLLRDKSEIIFQFERPGDRWLGWG